LAKQFLNDPEIDKPEVTRLMIAVKIEPIFPELNKNLKEEDDLFDLKKNIIDATVNLFKYKINMHASN